MRTFLVFFVGSLFGGLLMMLSFIATKEKPSCEKFTGTLIAKAGEVVTMDKDGCIIRTTSI